MLIISEDSYDRMCSKMEIKRLGERYELKAHRCVQILKPQRPSDSYELQLGQNPTVDAVIS